MGKKISRRQILMMLAMVSGGAGLVGARRLLDSLVASAQTGTVLLPRAYLPYVSRPANTPTPTPTNTSTPTNTPTRTPTSTNTPTRTPTSTNTPTRTPTSTNTPTRSSTSTPTNTPTRTPTPTPTNTSVPGTGPKVVHVHSNNATHWNGETAYWEHVDQATVNNMVDQGVMALTGASTVSSAWGTLVPGYQVGKGIAIKVNFNNSDACDDADGQIDASIQPVNAVVRGLKLMGVAEADIWVYDASRRIPDRFVGGNLYPGVRFCDPACRGSAGFGSTTVVFSPPAGAPTPPTTRLTKVLDNATYLINMPIMKPHRIAGLTLSFKNHFGSIDYPWNLHSYVGLRGSNYRTDYNPLVDLYKSPSIGGKTVLTIGDGLFAAKDFEAAPQTWTTFGNQVPNSLLFAKDPVAIDCVMCDLLSAEIAIETGSDNYLVLASQAGLGVFERGSPWGSGYQLITYNKIEA